MPRTMRLLLGTIIAVHFGCSSPRPPSSPIVIGGSGTLGPLTEAIAADFTKTHRDVPVQVSMAGTVDGLTRFCRGELDIVDASRPITAVEQSACQSSNTLFLELPVTHDALTVVVNVGNTWASSMTVMELRTLWGPAAEKRITRWNQVRADWPDRPIKLFGPGPESGTFDYFTEAVTGNAGASRKDYSAIGDYKVIVGGVGAEVESLGYLGYSYFDRHRDTLKALAIDDGDDSVGPGAISPSPESVGRGIYRPFSRPLFLYVNQMRLSRPEVKAFVDSYLRHARELASSAGTMPLLPNSYALAGQRLTKGTLGTMYQTPQDAKLEIDMLLTR